MAFFPVRLSRGYQQVLLPNGREAAISLGGSPVEAFAPGWRPQRVYSGLAPIYVLELRDEVAGDCFWLLDDGMNHLSTRLDTVDADMSKRLLERLSLLFSRLWIELFQDATVAPSAEVAAFLELSRVVRQALFAFWRSSRANQTRVAVMSDPALDWQSLHVEAAGVKRDRLLLALSKDYQAHVAGFVAEQAVSYPSVFTGFEVTTRHCLCLDTFRFLYRFVDEIYGRTFFVGLTGHHCSVCCILVPNAAGDVAFCRDPERYAEFGILSADLRADLIGHACEVGPLLVAYLQAAPETFVNVQRGESRHMGHMLWNELTGLMKLVDHVPADRLPLCVIPDSQSGGAEMYGPIDQIFPVLKGRVIRDIPDTSAFIDFVYTSTMCVVRATSLFVTQGLRDHIGRYIGGITEFDAARLELAAIRDKHALILTLGLRVENRTVIDIEEFCGRVIECASQQPRPLVVVIDGHNALSLSQSDAFVASNQEWRAATRPVDIERSIVAALRERFAHTGIQFIDTVGQSIAFSVFWINASDYFIAPWGTGMAKYSWICNKPGYVVTTDWNVKHRPDIGIYAEPYSQGAAALTYASDQMVVPQESAPILVVVPDWPRQSYENFSVDYDLLLPDFLQAMRVAAGTSQAATAITA